MKKRISKAFFWCLVVFLVIVSLFLQPQPVLALSIVGIQPNTVSNTTAVELVVTGVDFVEGAKVLLETVGALPTNFISSSVLVALLPSGQTPGVYTLTVINPDSSQVSLPNCLTITGPAIPTETPVPGGSPDRPLITIDSYTTGQESVSVGETATLQIRLRNKGQQIAFNVVLSFTPGDFIPLETGGLVSLNEMDPGESHKVNQPFTLSIDALYKRYAPVVVTASYTDVEGTAYTETFNLNIPVTPPSSGMGATITPTPTTTLVVNLRPQIIITGYSTDPEQLKPGNKFTLSLRAQNVGKSEAQRVTMILGGGSSSGGGAGQGTPDVGGVSGGSASLSNFAPLASSNVQYLGDVIPLQSIDIQVALIVNTSTAPGAYTMPISFTYTSPSGGSYTDDQVITLLVYNPPQLEINFYRDPGPLYAEQANMLPLQVVNLGRQTVVLGNLTVTAVNAILENNTTLVGPLDPGGYYTLDAVLIPGQPGPLELMVVIEYTDDFSQPSKYVDTIPVEIQEAVIIGPETGVDGEVPGEEVIPTESQPETIWQKILRFLRGFLGLNSAQPTPVPIPSEEIPSEELPPSKPIQPVGPKG